jgi:hypothetical protein
MSLWLSNQQKHVFFNCLAEDTQRCGWVLWHSCGECLTGHKVLKLSALVPEPEHGREAGREIVPQEELVELADGFDTCREATVDHVAVLGDELAAQGDSVEVIRVDGDELRGGIRLQGFLLKVSCALRLYTSHV